MNDIYVKFPIFANAKHKGKRYWLFSMLMNLDNSSHKGLWRKLDVLPFEWIYISMYIIPSRGADRSIILILAVESHSAGSCELGRAFL